MVQQVMPSDRAQIQEAISPLSSPAAWPAWKISTRPLVCPVSMAMKPATSEERELSRQNWRSGLAGIGALRKTIAEMSLCTGAKMSTERRRSGAVERGSIKLCNCACRDTAGGRKAHTVAWPARVAGIHES